MDYGKKDNFLSFFNVSVFSKKKKHEPLVSCGLGNGATVPGTSALFYIGRRYYFSSFLLHAMIDSFFPASCHVYVLC